MHSRYMDRMTHSAGSLGSASAKPAGGMVPWSRMAHAERERLRVASNALRESIVVRTTQLSREEIARVVTPKPTLAELGAAAKAYFARRNQSVAAAQPQSPNRIIGVLPSADGRPCAGR